MSRDPGNQGGQPRYPLARSAKYLKTVVIVILVVVIKDDDNHNKIPRIVVIVIVTKIGKYTVTTSIFLY